MNKQKIANALNYLKYFSTKHKFRNAFKKYGAKYIKGNVLDIGGGLSPFKQFIKPKTYQNIDNDPKLKPDILGSVMDMPIKDNTFDGIICTEVLEHLAEPEKCIKEMNRILRSKGFIYITAPMSWNLHYEPHDYYRFTKYGLKYLLEKNNFKVLKIKQVGGLFTTFGARLIDIIYKFFEKILLFILPTKIVVILLVPIFFPFQIVNYIVGSILDLLTPKDTFSYMVIARKK